MIERILLFTTAHGGRRTLHRIQPAARFDVPQGADCESRRDSLANFAFFENSGNRGSNDSRSRRSADNTVRLADEAIHIARDDPLASYLDIEAIVAAAKEVGADAVHPGYGFLAENPIFAERLAEEGITFIGPSPEVLRVLGDKITARETMSKAGLPIAKGSPGPVSIPRKPRRLPMILASL